ncbi:hypothetical protein PanWU01x14_222870 [Parasponia andersonii]|uniref:Uncharacterized protein n=1 Tax=Parasponia andersonii TaxID=3476 RepID=A0A2P5BNQ6_PARAD|nr:hypothetical protein PanWU01x14_222870 [Parasponia andersonii]
MRSPVIPTGAFSVLEMMEALVIPYYQFPANNFGHDFYCIVAVTTDPEILHNSKSCPRRSTNQAVSNCQALAMVLQCLLFRFLINVMKHIPCIRHVACFPHLPI